MHFSTKKLTKSLERFHENRLIYKGEKPPVDITSLLAQATEHNASKENIGKPNPANTIAGETANAVAGATDPRAGRKQSEVNKKAWDSMIDKDLAGGDSLNAMYKPPVKTRIKNLMSSTAGKVTKIPVLGAALKLPGQTVETVTSTVKKIPIVGAATQLPGKIFGSVTNGVKRILRRN